MAVNSTMLALGTAAPAFALPEPATGERGVARRTSPSLPCW